MKKIQYLNRKIASFFGVVLIIALMAGCGDVLDEVKNLSSYPAEGTFDDPLTANAVLNNLYAVTLSGWPLNMGNNADESGGIVPTDWVTINNGTMKFWPYSSIRRINIFLKEVPAGKIPTAQQGALIGQAKFLRAYNYFKMVYYHGGVPIIKDPQELTDDLMVTRNTTAECFDFIIEDLDDAISKLPVKYAGNDRGRIDQASARAFKGRVLLYKASPQFNSANPYGNAHWAAAYAANKEAKDFLDQNGYGLLEDFTKSFRNKRT
jgi:starch-binding outer membrane protein, SusD/RagB family